MWGQHYQLADDTLRWHGADENPPAATCISSAPDPDAHLAKQEVTPWVGYNVHHIETCDDEQPRLIIPAATTTAPTADDAVTPCIHTDLQRRDLLPSTHLVDTGFLNTALLSTLAQPLQVCAGHLSTKLRNSIPQSSCDCT